MFIINKVEKVEQKKQAEQAKLIREKYKKCYEIKSNEK